MSARPSTAHAALLATLQQRFEKHVERHPKLAWATVLARLEGAPEKLAALAAMEESGGEPDVTAHDPESGEVTFTDCSAESPAGRRSCCYDQEGLESRKEHRPEHSAVELAEAMGVELLDEAQYRALQALETFDAKTSSWLKTPADIRKRLRRAGLPSPAAWRDILIGCRCLAEALRSRDPIATVAAKHRLTGTGLAAIAKRCFGLGWHQLRALSAWEAGLEQALRFRGVVTEPSSSPWETSHD